MLNGIEVAQKFVLQCAFNILKWAYNKAGPGTDHLGVPPCDKEAYKLFCDNIHDNIDWSEVTAFKFTDSSAEHVCGEGLWPVSVQRPALPAAVKALQARQISGTTAVITVAPVVRSRMLRHFR